MYLDKKKEQARVETVNAIVDHLKQLEYNRAAQLWLLMNFWVRKMTEYWLQKKTIGGWSTVTWYSDQEQAKTNYVRLRSGIGYSYRLVSVEIVQEHLLDEVVAVEAPELEDKKNITKQIVDKLYADKPVSNGWADTANGWNSKVSVNVVTEKEHGLSGSVWVVHHGNKDKTRVSANELDGYLAKGYEKAGPRTQFREG